MSEPVVKPRSRIHRPERIKIGDEEFVRNDIKAGELSETERTLNRRDAYGAPFIYIGGVKYRPNERFDAFMISRIQTKSQPTRRRGRA